MIKEFVLPRSYIVHDLKKCWLVINEQGRKELNNNHHIIVRSLYVQQCLDNRKSTSGKFRQNFSKGGHTCMCKHVSRYVFGCVCVGWMSWKMPVEPFLPCQTRTHIVISDLDSVQLQMDSNYRSHFIFPSLSFLSCPRKPSLIVFLGFHFCHNVFRGLSEPERSPSGSDQLSLRTVSWEILKTIMEVFSWAWKSPY